MTQKAYLIHYKAVKTFAAYQRLTQRQIVPKTSKNTENMKTIENNANNGANNGNNGNNNEIANNGNNGNNANNANTAKTTTLGFKAWSEYCVKLEGATLGKSGVIFSDEATPELFKDGLLVICKTTAKTTLYCLDLKLRSIGVEAIVGKMLRLHAELWRKQAAKNSEVGEVYNVLYTDTERIEYAEKGYYAKKFGMIGSGLFNRAVALFPISHKGEIMIKKGIDLRGFTTASGKDETFSTLFVPKKREILFRSLYATDPDFTDPGLIRDLKAHIQGATKGLGYTDISLVVARLEESEKQLATTEKKIASSVKKTAKKTAKKATEKTAKTA